MDGNWRLQLDRLFWRAFIAVWIRASVHSGWSRITYFAIGDRVFDADASVTQWTLFLEEQPVARRVVQIDAEVIRKDELHQTERVVGAWPLTEAKTSW